MFGGSNNENIGRKRLGTDQKKGKLWLSTKNWKRVGGELQSEQGKGRVRAEEKKAKEVAGVSRKNLGKAR